MWGFTRHRFLPLIKGRQLVTIPLLNTRYTPYTSVIIILLSPSYFKTYQNHSAQQSAYISHHRWLSLSTYQGPGQSLKGRDPGLRSRPPCNAEGTGAWSFPAHSCQSFFCLNIRHQILSPQLKDLRQHLVDGKHLKLIQPLLDGLRDRRVSMICHPLSNGPENTFFTAPLPSTTAQSSFLAV